MHAEHRLSVPVIPADHSQGPDEAPITLVQYGDFECRYCARAFPIIRELQREFAGELRFVFRHFPLVDIHYQAMSAAKAAEAAGLQGRFWEAYAYLYGHQRALDEEAVFAFVREQGLDTQRFALDLESPRVERRVLMDIESGVRSGVNGTPAFFINGNRLEGEWSLERFREAFSASTRAAR